ncbi:hypothetical protein, partial [Pseudomonas putida]|uniref:hypothetical protein n=1 Tax=Pseudomonas putida TaxID=303 RepID=UPI0020978924
KIELETRPKANVSQLSGLCHFGATLQPIAGKPAPPGTAATTHDAVCTDSVGAGLPAMGREAAPNDN